MVADGGTPVLADAAQSAASGSQRGSRGQGMQGGMPSGGQMPDMGDMPQMGEMPEGMPQGGAPAQAEEDTGLVARVKNMVSGVTGKVRAWLYEGVETTSAAQVTGSLVKVEVGMQNDDYAQITSGLSEGDVVLYTASDDDNSSSMFGGMMMGGMGGGSMGGGMGGMR